MTNETTTNKTTARKSTATKSTRTAKAKVSEEKIITPTETVKNESVNVPVIEQPKVEKKKLRGITEIPQSEMFPVRSMRTNPLIYIDHRSGNQYEWQEFGDVEFLSFADINSMRSRSRKFIDQMWIVFDDEEIVKAFNLQKKYDEVFSKYDENMLLNESAHELREILPKLPQGVKKSLSVQAVKIAKQEIESGNHDLMDSLNKIKVIEEKLGVDLSLLLDK
ncbi:hypothetical protein M3649_04160 [Ureibacillus chungkukjangi]|uniref:hypothetical protein n=1 Tax=Ureibacillus chungkukjangi TaxID=1202712 RepID=UPI00203F795C|nr:hypothetical protein [Ureibacillus chungkukjangi]MCM3387327.1 hypothetical protein [Ureibacillus chungkukjangi]